MNLLTSEQYSQSILSVVEDIVPNYKHLYINEMDGRTDDDHTDAFILHSAHQLKAELNVSKTPDIDCYQT